MTYILSLKWWEPQNMRVQVVWPVVASFLMLIAVLLLAIDASQDGDLSVWLKRKMESFAVAEGAGKTFAPIATSTVPSGPSKSLKVPVILASHGPTSSSRSAAASAPTPKGIGPAGPMLQDPSLQSPLAPLNTPSGDQARHRPAPATPGNSSFQAPTLQASASRSDSTQSGLKHDSKSRANNQSTRTGFLIVELPARPGTDGADQSGQASSPAGSQSETQAAVAGNGTASPTATTAVSSAGTTNLDARASAIARNVYPPITLPLRPLPAVSAVDLLDDVPPSELADDDSAKGANQARQTLEPGTDPIVPDDLLAGQTIDSSPDDSVAGGSSPQSANHDANSVAGMLAPLTSSNTANAAAAPQPLAPIGSALAAAPDLEEPALAPLLSSTANREPGLSPDTSLEDAARPDANATAARENRSDNTASAENDTVADGAGESSLPESAAASLPSGDKAARLADEASTPESLWPVPSTLTERLESTLGSELVGSWSAATLQVLEQFPRLESADDPAIETLLAQLASQINALDSFIVLASTIPVQTSDMAAGPVAADLRLLSQQLVQYWSVAGAAYRLAALSPQRLAEPGSPGSAGSVPAMQVANQRLLLPELEPAWSDYLSLGDLQKQLETLQTDPRLKRRAAQKFLARLTSPIMTAEQQQHAIGLFQPETLDALRDLATEPLDLHQTMSDLDAWQKSGHGFHGARLASVMQGLGWQDDEPSRLLAQTLDQQLRSANLRISVSDEMLNRLLPTQPEISQPVHERVLGADVQGHSRIANRLQIKLIPDPQQIQLRLESIGLVRSRTEASQRGFTVDNLGDSRFQAFKRLVIGRNGIVSDRPNVSATSSSRVIGMRSQYDSMPVFGWVARKIASRHIEEQAPVANQMVKQRLQSEVSQRFEEQIDAHLYDLQDYLAATLIQPLTALELEPTPMEMRSTEDRIVMQYRMAGRDQLAAGAARPLGLQRSLMSLQLHESLINNVLARIDLAGQSFTGPELTQHLVEVFGQQANAAEDSSQNYRLVFASHDPVAVHFRNGAAIVELNIRSLQIGKGKVRKNLTVQVTFHPRVEGSRLVMVQDNGGIRLKGSRLGAGDQAVLRTIFTAMFRSTYDINLIPPGITDRLKSEVATSQFDLSHGWLAVSFDLAGSPQSQQPVEQRPTGQHSHQIRLSDTIQR